MDVQITVVKILDAQRFVSRRDGSELLKNVFVGTTQEQYAKQIAFSVIGAERFAQMGIVIGGTYNVSFDVESREWNGRYFTECRRFCSCFNSGRSSYRRKKGAQAQSAPQPQPQPQQVQQSPSQAVASQSSFNGNGGGADDLPF